MSQNDFSFLSGKITQPNLETDYFLLNVNKVFVTAPEALDLERDLLLLKFTQRIWKLPETVQNAVLTGYYSMYYNKNEDEVPFFVHDIIYEDELKDKYRLEIEKQCLPTLSFRTLIYDSNVHIKFGLPIHYGSTIRLNKKKEVLTALYLSDYIRSLPTIHKLEFFLEYKGYSMAGLEDYSVSYRQRKSSEKGMPFSCYFNQILNHGNLDPIKRLSKTLDFLIGFFHDFNRIYKTLEEAGLGLEIHGQNLLVKLNESGEASGTYLYRDLGTCTLGKEKHEEQGELNKYYQNEYEFEFDQLIDPGYFAWRNYREFFMSFILHNLDGFTKTEKISFNAYEWFENCLLDLPDISNIYELNS